MTLLIVALVYAMSNLAAAFIITNSYKKEAQLSRDHFDQKWRQK